MRLNRSYLSAALALLAGVSLRLCFVHKWPHVAGDALVYGDIATNMLRHHIYGFTQATGIRPTLIRLPGYPVFMAACFVVAGVGNYVSVLYAQLFLDLLTCCLLAALARRLFGTRAGLCALWLAALCPFTANYVAAPLTEIPAIFCAALAFFSLERWITVARTSNPRNLWPWPIGLALSFAILLRPDRGLLAVAVVLPMVWMVTRAPAAVRARLVRDIATVCLLITLPLAAWAMRNWRVFHVFQPLAPRFANDPGERNPIGFQRWYRTWAIDFDSTVDVYWTYDGAPIFMEDLPPRAFDNPAQRARTEALITAYNLTVQPTVAFDDEFAAIAADRVRAHPVRFYITLPILKVADMWLRPRVAMLPVQLDWWHIRRHPVGSLASIAYALLNLAYLILAAIGLWRWRRQGWSGQRALGYAMVAFVLMRSGMLLTIDNSEPRYTLDCFPIVILLGAFALKSLLAPPASNSAN